MHIPDLKTSRLVLEPLSLAHSEGVFALWSNPQVCRYSGIVKDYDGNVIPMPAASSQDSDRIIDFWLRAAADGWGFRWAVLLGDDQREFTGMIGFNSIGKCAEIAYHLHPSHWGEGIMTEAAHAAVNWIRAGATTEIEAFIEPENKASIALAKRLDMAATGAFSEGAQRYLGLTGPARSASRH